MKAVLLMAALVVAASLSGCLDVYLDLIPHSDGSYTIRHSWVLPATVLDEALKDQENGDKPPMTRAKLMDSLLRDESFVPQNWKYLSRNRGLVRSDTVIDSMLWITTQATTSTVDSLRRYWWGALSLNQARIDSVGPTGVEISKTKAGMKVTFSLNPDRTEKKRKPRTPSPPDKEMIGHEIHFRLFSPEVIQSSIKPPCRIIPDGAEWPVRFTQIDTLEALCKLPQKVSFMIRPAARKK
jgi:hypothetical protein